jgi:predicted metalloprotease with PDZ domain
MKYTRLVGIVLLASAATAPLGAQQEPPRRREPGRVRVFVDDEHMTPKLMPLLQRRARLGVVVSLEAKETDSLGAFIQSVTPGGPASKAGLRSGDIITKVDGQSLLSTEGRKVDEEESPPGVRLIELAAKFEPNQEVAIEYLRGDQRRTATVTTGDEPILGFEGDAFKYRFPSEEGLWKMPGLRFERMAPPERVEMRRPFGEMVFFGGPLFDLELAPLNADLGWYFGANEGVLVVKAPESSSLGLKAGDVVLTIDGRKVSGPSSLLRILRSYDEGESFKLEIMRQKQRQTITGRMEKQDWE